MRIQIIQQLDIKIGHLLRVAAAMPPDDRHDLPRTYLCADLFLVQLFEDAALVLLGEEQADTHRLVGRQITLRRRDDQQVLRQVCCLDVLHRCQIIAVIRLQQVFQLVADQQRRRNAFRADNEDFSPSRPLLRTALDPVRDVDRKIRQLILRDPCRQLRIHGRHAFRRQIKRGPVVTPHTLRNRIVQLHPVRDPVNHRCDVVDESAFEHFPVRELHEPRLFDAGEESLCERDHLRILPVCGDRVEILTSASSKGPSTDWLRICKTPQAKAKIRQFLKKALKEENIELGRGMIEKECARRGVRLADLCRPEYYESILKRTGFTDFDDICGAVGYGGMAAVYVVSKLMEEQKAKVEPVQTVQNVEDMVSEEKRLSQHRAHHGIVLTGNEDLDIPVRFAKCCSPVPGDEIVGYITRGRGVTIHKASCVNAATGEEERLIPVEWASNGENTFYATVTIIAYDRVNMLGEIATIIGENNVSIRAASIQNDDKTRISTLRLTLDVHSREEMDKVMGALRNKSDILDVYR